jgi:hypothetical protein
MSSSQTPNLSVISNRLAGLLSIPEDKKEAVIANLVALIKYTLADKKSIKRKKIKILNKK